MNDLRLVLWLVIWQINKKILQNDFQIQSSLHNLFDSLRLLQEWLYSLILRGQVEPAEPLMLVQSGVLSNSCDETSRVGTEVGLASPT